MSARMDEMLAKEHGGRRCRAEVSVERLTEPAEVMRRLQEGSEGWVCFASGIDPRYPGKPRPTELDELKKGYPLSAELALGEKVSLKLCHDGSAWVLTTVQEVPAEGEDADWAFERSFVSTERSRRMKYCVYWRRSDSPHDRDIRPFRPFVARFVAWGEE